MRWLPSHRTNVNDALLLRDIVEHPVIPNSQFPNGRNGLEWRYEVDELLAISSFDCRFVGKHFFDVFEDHRPVIGLNSSKILFNSRRKPNTVHAYIIAHAPGRTEMNILRHGEFFGANVAEQRVGGFVVSLPKPA